MAIKQVILPERRSSGSSGGSIFGSLGKAGQILGTVGTLTGNPILAGVGAAATTGSSLLETTSSQSQRMPKLVETSDLAMNRRLNLTKDDPELSLESSISALESLNLPEEQKARLLKPMLMAKNARV
jgi:hypothetical protein